LLVKRVFFLLNAAFAMAILDLISRLHLPSFVNMLPKNLKHSTFSSCFWYDTVPVKNASANVSFYTSSPKMPNFEL